MFGEKISRNNFNWDWQPNAQRKYSKLKGSLWAQYYPIFQHWYWYSAAPRQENKYLEVASVAIPP